MDTAHTHTPDPASLDQPHCSSERTVRELPSVYSRAEKEEPGPVSGPHGLCGPETEGQRTGRTRKHTGLTGTVRVFSGSDFSSLGSGRGAGFRRVWLGSSGPRRFWGNLKNLCVNQRLETVSLETVWGRAHWLIDWLIDRQQDMCGPVQGLWVQFSWWTPFYRCSWWCWWWW